MELFGLTWAEAMVCGCAVVASDVGSLPKLIKDNGLLFEVANPYDLSQKVIYLLENEQVRISLGQKAKGYVEREFDPPLAVERLILIYKGSKGV